MVRVTLGIRNIYEHMRKQERQHFIFKIFIYLAVSGLSCCGIFIASWDLSVRHEGPVALRHVGS